MPELLKIWRESITMFKNPPEISRNEVKCFIIFLIQITKHITNFNANI